MNSLTFHRPSSLSKLLLLTATVLILIFIRLCAVSLCVPVKQIQYLISLLLSFSMCTHLCRLLHTPSIPTPPGWFISMIDWLIDWLAGWLVNHHFLFAAPIANHRPAVWMLLPPLSLSLWIYINDINNHPVQYWIATPPPPPPPNWINP